jgi:hypothetical protein
MVSSANTMLAGVARRLPLPVGLFVNYVFSYFKF